MINVPLTEDVLEAKVALETRETALCNTWDVLFKLVLFLLLNLIENVGMLFWPWYRHNRPKDGAK